MDDIDLTLLDDSELVFPKIPFIEPIALIPGYQDVTLLSNQISQMNVELNSQDLRIRIEQAKRRKLRVTLKSLYR